MKKRGVFITFEGTDGVGKTTQIKMLARWLTARGRRVFLTREPGGSPLSEKIRHLLLDPTQSISPKAELMLYEAARVEHVEKIVKPQLKKGSVVLCDRFTDATTAYQGYARKLDLSTISLLNKIASGGLVPDLTLWLDRPIRVALGHAHARNRSGGDRMEREGLRFQRLVRRGYAALHRSQPARVKRISVRTNPLDTQTAIQTWVRRIGR